MKWAGPAQLNWAGPNPKVIGPNSAQKMLLGCGPVPAQTAGLGQKSSGPEKKGIKHGGEIFPPRLLHAEQFCMQEVTNIAGFEKKCAGGEEAYLAQRRLRWRRWQRLSSRWFPSKPATSSRFLLGFSFLNSPGFKLSFFSLFFGFSLALSPR